MRSVANRRRQSAFTLIEILVGLVIVETLFAICLPSYLSSVQVSRQEVANSNAKSLALAVQSHAVTSQVYDTTLADYAIDLGGTLPLNPCTATTTGYTIASATSTTATVVATAGTNCGTWAPTTYALVL